MELLLARGKERKEKKKKKSLKLQQLCFSKVKKEEMSSGEQSFHNLYEFFSFSSDRDLQLGKLFRWHFSLLRRQQQTKQKKKLK